MGLAGMALVSMTLVTRSASPMYINNGTVQCSFNTEPPPQIDAIAFVNNGSFCSSLFSSNFFSLTLLPYDFQNVLYYTNNGIMIGDAGYRFSHVSDAGQRGPSDTFFNSGTIEVTDTGGFVFLVGGSGIIGGSLFSSSRLEIWATNIINQGTLSAGPGGLIQLQGKTVNLTNSSIIIEPLGSANAGLFNGFFGGLCTSFFYVTPTNFFPDVGLYDIYWGMDRTTNLALPPLLTGGPPFFVQPPAHRVTNEIGGSVGFMALFDPASWALITSSSPTNITVQTVFVQTWDSNITANVKWVNATYPDLTPPANDFQTAVVEFSSPATNLITGNIFTNTLYLIDQLATDTNFNVLTNIVSSETFRPSSFILSRIAPCDYVFFGIPSNSVVTPDLFYNPVYSNRVATNIYAAYSAEVDNLASRLPQVPGVSLTNLPGRVEIVADELNLTRARIRGEGMVNIKTKNLVSTSTNAMVDVQNLNFDLASTTGTLRIKNLARDSVQRFTGLLTAWSSVWTNQFTDPFSSNVVDVRFHALVVDGTLLSSTKRVVVNDFAARSTNAPSSVVIGDNLLVNNSFLVDSENLTVQGGIQLSPTLRWGPANLPRIVNLTNLGKITLTGQADFGFDRPNPYTNLVNRGTISAFTHFIRADYLENSGSILSGEEIQTFAFRTNLLGTIVYLTNIFIPTVGPIGIETKVGKLDGGKFGTRGNLSVKASVLKFNNYLNEAGGALSLNVAETLQDNGPQSSNLWRVGKGFQVSGPRPAGDLKGTAIESVAARFQVVAHTWPGEDRGVSTAGFENNLALGRLALNGTNFSQFAFVGTGVSNALYVDLLEMSGSVAADLDNAIFLESNIHIYFADARSTDPNSPVSVEQLDGRQFGIGQMHWVKDYSGPNSSVDVVVTGNKTVRMNRGLRESLVLDSDGDGIANGFDLQPLTPFDGIKFVNVTLTNKPPLTVLLSWEATPLAVFQLESSTNIVSPVWQVLLKYTNSGFNSSVVTFPDSNPVSSGSGQRYYRLRYTQ